MTFLESVVSVVQWLGHLSLEMTFASSVYGGWELYYFSHFFLIQFVKSIFRSQFSSIQLNVIDLVSFSLHNVCPCVCFLGRDSQGDLSFIKIRPSCWSLHLSQIYFFLFDHSIRRKMYKCMKRKDKMQSSPKKCGATAALLKYLERQLLRCI